MYEDTNNQCVSKIDKAIDCFNNMSDSEREEFMTSNEYVVSTARARLQAWAANQGRTISLNNNEYVISSVNSAMNNPFINNGSALGIVLTVSSILAATVVGVYFHLKRKNEK